MQNGKDFYIETKLDVASMKKDIDTIKKDLSELRSLVKDAIVDIEAKMDKFHQDAFDTFVHKDRFVRMEQIVYTIAGVILLAFLQEVIKLVFK